MVDAVIHQGWNRFWFRVGGVHSAGPGAIIVVPPGGCTTRAGQGQSGGEWVGTDLVSAGRALLSTLAEAYTGSCQELRFSESDSFTRTTRS